MAKIKIFNVEDEEDLNEQIKIDSENSRQSIIDEIINLYTKQEIEDALKVLDKNHIKQDMINTYIPHKTEISCDKDVEYSNINNFIAGNKTNTEQKYDAVDNPSYYADSKIQPIEYIEDRKLGYHLGTAIKYISRAGKKHENGMTDKEKAIQDLNKSIYFIKRKIYLIKNDIDY